MTNHHYGEPPEEIMFTDLDGVWTEFMHYLYLPVRIPYDDLGPKTANFAVPERLEFLMPAVWKALEDSREQVDHLDDPYVYVTARRGYATPGNPLNRPGWHCDDFGGTDLNYTWCDAYPTRYLDSGGRVLAIPQDDSASMLAMAQFAETYAFHTSLGLEVVEVPLNTMMRLTPYVIHDTPIIPNPGGMRSFFKVSVSSHRYDLIGNSHNHLLDYDWPMYSREALRNQPSGGNADYSGMTS